MTIVTEILKDSFDQDIIEGKLCILHQHHSSEFDIGYIVETRKLIKVAYVTKSWNPVTQQLDIEQIREEWFSRTQILMFEEDNIFNIMNASLLHKMATVRGHAAPLAEAMLKRKEKKRVKLQAKSQDKS